MGAYRIVETATGRIEWFETGDKEYLTWVLAPKGDDPVSDQIADGGRYQWELVTMALRLLPHGATFLDVGAHAGAWSLPMAKARPDLRIDAFEPQTVPFGQLCANAFLNNLKNVRPHPFALGAHSGPAQLRLPDPKNRASATLTGTGNILETVRVQTLAETRISADVIKLSVCGSELAVLAGGFALLRQRHPLVFFAAPDPHARGAQQEHARLFAYIEKLGYSHLELLPRHHVAFPAQRRGEIEKARAEP